MACMCGDRCHCGQRPTRWNSLTLKQKLACAKRSAAYKARDPEAFRKRALANRKRQFLRNPRVFRAREMLKSAKKRGVACNLILDDILAVFPIECPVFGTKFSMNIKRTKGPTDTSPTLDRINSARGYRKGNIWVISSRANRIKNDATAKELRAVADAIERMEAVR